MNLVCEKNSYRLGGNGKFMYPRSDMIQIRSNEFIRLLIGNKRVDANSDFFCINIVF